MRTIPGISQLLQRLDHVVSTEFTPSITGDIAPSDLQRKLLSLSTKLGGGVRNTNIFKVIQK